MGDSRQSFAGLFDDDLPDHFTLPIPGQIFIFERQFVGVGRGYRRGSHFIVPRDQGKTAVQHGMDARQRCGMDSLAGGHQADR